MNNDLNLTVLRRLLDQRRKLDKDIHNVANTLLKPNMKIQYRVGIRDYIGRVVEIIGLPGRTQVRVENVTTSKQRDIWLSDVTGLVQEIEHARI